MKKIMVYTTQMCPYCESAKRLLEQRGISYDEEMVSRSDDDKRMELYNKSRMRTFPQIFNGEEIIGGYTELAALDEKDQLASLK